MQTVLTNARQGGWVLICPLQHPQYLTKLLQQLREMKDAVHPNFRLLIDFQGFTQNEIPDSLLAQDSVTFHLDDSNADAMPSFGDIWTKILDESYLLLLTSEEKGQNPIRNIDFLQNPDWTSQEASRTKNLKQIYFTSVQNKSKSEQFREFLDKQKNDFEEQLKRQAEITKREMEEEKHRQAEERKRSLARRQLENVMEVDDDGVFSDRKRYAEQIVPTEHTQSVYKVHYEDEIKNEKNSVNYTIGNV